MERAVSVIVSAALIIGMFLAFSPSVQQVEVGLDRSLEHFSKGKVQHLTLGMQRIPFTIGKRLTRAALRVIHPAAVPTLFLRPILIVDI